MHYLSDKFKIRSDSLLVLLLRLLINLEYDETNKRVLLLVALLELVQHDGGDVPLHREVDRLHRRVAVREDRLHDVLAQIILLVLDVVG